MAIQLDPNEWSISAPQPSNKGGKTCLISNQNKPIGINLGLGNALGCPWGASSFDDDSTRTRINLDMTLDEENADLFRQIDEWLIAYAIKIKRRSSTKPKSICKSQKATRGSPELKRDTRRCSEPKSIWKKCVAVP